MPRHFPIDYFFVKVVPLLKRIALLSPINVLIYTDVLVQMYEWTTLICK